MKILVISNYNDIHVVRPEAEIFVSLAQRGYDITVMTYGQSNYVKRFKEVGIKVIDFHPEKKNDKQEIDFIRHAVIKKKFDVIHLFNNVATVNGIKACKNLPIKVVLYRGYSANMHWWDPTLYTKHLHRRVDYVICNSLGVAYDLEKNGKLSPKKIVVINKGHDLNWYTDVKEVDIRKELGLPEDAFLAVLVANNRRMKGVKYLLEATKKLSVASKIHLVLIGKDILIPKNQKILDQSPFKDHVHYLGYRKDALGIVKSCNTFVLTSIKGESITKSVLEAMSMCVTPIISDILGNKELIVHDESGLVVKSKDSTGFATAIQKLYERPELCKQYGINAQQRVTNVLSHDQTVEKYISFYNQL